MVPSSDWNDPQDDLVTSMTPQGKEAMRQAVQNSLVIEKICFHLKIRDLCTLRLVNKSLYSFSTSHVQMHNLTRIVFKYGQETCKYRCANRDLETFNSMIQNSRQIFPCTNFYFGMGPLHHPSIQQFFLLPIASTITNLTLYYILDGSEEGPSLISTLNALLTPMTLPNIRKLDLQSFDCDFTDENSPIHLPSLKLLSFCEGQWKIALQILKGTPSLQTIENLSPNDAHILQKLGRPLHINSLDVHGSHVISNVSTILNSGASIRHLSVLLNYVPNEEFWLQERTEERRKLYQKLLWTFKNIETLRLQDLIPLFPRIRFSRLPHLKQLTLDGLSAITFREHNPVLPEGIRPIEIFPNLQILDITKGHLPSSFFEDGATFPSVRKIRTYGKQYLHDKDFCSKVKSMCPNFKDVYIQVQSSDCQCVLSMVYKSWTHLESLTLYIRSFNGSKDVSTDSRKFSSIFMDPFITGMSPASCQLLFESSVCPEKFVNYEMLRRESSILELKHLKYFEINLGNYIPPKPRHAEDSRELTTPIFMSHVSQLYGFRLIPDLRVKLKYQVHYKYKIAEFYPTIDTIIPYVDFSVKDHSNRIWD